MRVGPDRAWIVGNLISLGRAATMIRRGLAATPPWQLPQPLRTPRLGTHPAQDLGKGIA